VNRVICVANLKNRVIWNLSNVKPFGFVNPDSRLFSRATGARPVSHSASGQRASACYRAGPLRERERDFSNTECLCLAFVRVVSRLADGSPRLPDAKKSWYYALRAGRSAHCASVFVRRQSLG